MENRINAARALQRGAHLMQAGKLDEADAEFKKAEQLDTSDYRAILGQVEVAMRAEKFESAIQLLQRQLARDPRSSILQMTLGDVYSRFHRDDEALAAYQELAKTDSPGAALRLGNMYRLKGDYEAAAYQYGLVIKAQPQDVVSRFQLALTMEAAGRKADAARLYEEILSRVPTHGPALNNLAYIEANNGKLDRALTLALAARKVLPKDGNAMDTLGWVYLKKSKPDQAIPLLREALLQNSASAERRAHLVMALDQAGDHSQPAEDLRMALRNPDETQVTLRKLLTDYRPTPKSEKPASAVK